MTTADENQTTAKVQPAFAEPSEVRQGGPLLASDVVTDTQYAELLQKIRNSVSDFQMDFQVKRPVAQDILQESQAKFSEIIGIVNHRLQQAETDRARLETEIAELRSNLSAVLSETYQVSQQLQQAESDRNRFESEIVELRSRLSDALSETYQIMQQMSVVQAEKTDIEATLKQTAAESQMWEQEVTLLKSELVKASALVEAAVAEKNKFEKKLNQFQEQWDKYVAGS